MTDCAPACLLSVITYYGGFVPLDIIRTNSFTDKSGTSAYNLINCAKKYGFESSGVKIKRISNLPNKNLPAIAHIKIGNGLYHYVVIYKITSKDVYLMDPSKGKTKISIDAFQKVFTGIIILLHPYKKIEKLDKPKSTKQLIFDIIKRNKIKILFLIVTSFILVLTSIYLNYFIKAGTSVIAKSYKYNYLYKVCIIFLGLYLLKNILDYIKNNLTIRLSKNISWKLYGDFSSKILYLPLNFIRSRTSGEIISRYQELSDVNNLLPNIILSIFLDLIMAFITVYFSFSISRNLTFIIMISMLVYFIISYTFKNPTLYKINKNMDENANLNSSVIECINNLRSIKNLNNERNMEKKLKSVCLKTINDNYKLNNYYNNISFIKNLYYDMITFIISSYGLYLIFQNQITAADLFTFILITNYFSEPIKDLVDMITKYCFIKTSINKISEFQIISDVNNEIAEFKPGDIQISNLSYAYNGVDYVINNYSCFIKNKSKVLIKGYSGSGKSTLCQLISKQLTNYSGKILIAGNDLEKINNKSLRSNVTYIGQKDTLIIDTIENNIKYERKVDNKEFKTICKICEIDKIINKKFNMYNNLISESSDNISGGERQRITLARGLIKSGDILILDESLSEVSKDMEIRILRRILNYFHNKTIIYVSHRNYHNMFDQTIKI